MRLVLIVLLVVFLAGSASALPPDSTISYFRIEQTGNGRFCYDGSMGGEIHLQATLRNSGGGAATGYFVAFRPVDMVGFGGSDDYAMCLYVGFMVNPQNGVGSLTVTHLAGSQEAETMEWECLVTDGYGDTLFFMYDDTERITSPEIILDPNEDSWGQSINLVDFGEFADAYNTEEGEANYRYGLDFNNDGYVNLTDFGIWVTHYNHGCASSAAKIPADAIDMGDPDWPAH